MQARKRKLSEGYSVDIKCENTADFLVQVTGDPALIAKIW